MTKTGAPLGRLARAMACGCGGRSARLRRAEHSRSALSQLLLGLSALAPAAAITVVFTLHDTVYVTDHSQQHHLTFGWPFGWIAQDLSSLDPPLPYEVSMGSPWEHPMIDVRWLALGADVALGWAACFGVMYVIFRLFRGAEPAATRAVEGLRRRRS